MNAVCENSISNIKKAMTQIRRRAKSPAMSNYYNNCDKSSEIFALYGRETVVFWNDENGVIRIYFYSTDADELAALLKNTPKSGVIDEITRTHGQYKEIFERAGFEQLAKMMRFTCDPTKDDERNKNIYISILQQNKNVRCAEESDCDELLKKMHEEFDLREIHPCSREELLEYIRKRWVAVCVIDNELRGFYIFTVEHHRRYGYLIWNGSDPFIGLALRGLVEVLFSEYVKDVPLEKQRPAYSWVNADNKNSRRIIELSHSFDGLYDDIYVHAGQ